MDCVISNQGEEIKRLQKGISHDTIVDTSNICSVLSDTFLHCYLSLSFVFMWANEVMGSIHNNVSSKTLIFPLTFRRSFARLVS